MNPRWLIRAALWVRRPPSPARVKLVVGLIVVVITVGLIEHYIGWPSWAQLDRLPRPPKF
ncbi:hypothetical protein C8N43_0449 [Litoreibacter ponti]|uniref:Uncharacterized protein n=1 Tax=Litoreibacter ponti TaxID=1510457 RepID=A0A2T6BIA8_9RHOB|nr:hypothetical protein [Litoreibacter ponti]PTX55803.1 hypothetical protein C8N43_0449 [Litoreibacter ponti]